MGPRPGTKDLEGNLALVLEQLGEIDRGHPALPKLALDAVAPGQPTDLGCGSEVGSDGSPADGQGLRRLADQCGADYQGGVLLYAGDSAFRLGGGNLAMPLARLWEM